MAFIRSNFLQDNNQMHSYARFIKNKFYMTEDSAINVGCDEFNDAFCFIQLKEAENINVTFDKSRIKMQKW